MTQSDLEIDADRLTVVLAARLAAIAPAGFRVRAEDGMLWYSCEQGRLPGQLNNYSPGASGTYVRLNFDAHADDMSHAESAAAVA